MTGPFYLGMLRLEMFKKLFTFILIPWCLLGCVSSQVVLFNNSSTQTSTAGVVQSLPQNVSIFRSQHPYTSYTELGLITFRDSGFLIERIYEQLRKDAAKQGADSIWDLKITGETHTEQVYERVCRQVTNCNPEGICAAVDECHDEPVSKEVSTYTATGSLIRKK